MISIDNMEIGSAENPPPCEGMIYPARISQYFGSRGVVAQKVEMVPQIRLSCSGCAWCYNAREFLDINVENQLLDLGSVKSGKLYRLGYAYESMENFATIWNEIPEDKS